MCWLVGLRAWFEGEDSSTSLQLCDASPQYHADSCPAIDPLHHSAHSDHEQHAYVQHPVQGQLGEADLNQCVPAASSLPTEFEHGQPATLVLAPFAVSHHLQNLPACSI